MGDADNRKVPGSGCRSQRLAYAGRIRDNCAESSKASDMQLQPAGAFGRRPERLIAPAGAAKQKGYSPITKHGLPLNLSSTRHYGLVTIHFGSIGASWI